MLDQSLGLCTITPSTTDSAVILDGSAGSGGGGAVADRGGETPSDPPAACIPAPDNPERCYSGRTGRPTDAAPVVTIADVASFVPDIPSPVSEPDGWAIAGLPANLVGPGAPSIVVATLLGAPAEVRFTPIGWRWTLGDGAVLDAAVPGASWAALAVPEFAATATSHVYVAPGAYRVGLAVTLAAEYRVGGGPWLPVAGTVSAAAPGFDLVVGAASTVLVDRTCLAGSRGPGCG